MGKVVDSLYLVSHHLSLPRPVVEKMMEAGAPVREDGAYDIDEIRQWRDEKLGLAQIKDKSGSLDKFRGNRADIYAIEQAEALRTQGIIRREKFTLKQIREMKLKEAVELYSELRRDQKDKFEQERLERGESTENITVIVAAIKDLKRRKAIDRGIRPNPDRQGD